MKIKVCGITNTDEYFLLSNTGLIDYCGFIFYPKSPRYVNEIPLIEANTLKVGVFVNEKLECIQKKIECYNLHTVQLHGDETPDYCQKIQLLGVQVIKAFGVDETIKFAAFQRYESVCDYFLFDTKCAERGGSGRQFNWEILQNYKGKTPFFLSGGIQYESWKELIRFEHLQWAGIDLNSGFEYATGKKNLGEIIEFLQKILPYKNEKKVNKLLQIRQEI